MLNQTKSGSDMSNAIVPPDVTNAPQRGSNAKLKWNTAPLGKSDKAGNP